MRIFEGFFNIGVTMFFKKKMYVNLLVSDKSLFEENEISYFSIQNNMTNIEGVEAEDAERRKL